MCAGVLHSQQSKTFTTRMFKEKLMGLSWQVQGEDANEIHSKQTMHRGMDLALCIYYHILIINTSPLLHLVSFLAVSDLNKQQVPRKPCQPLTKHCDMMEVADLNFKRTAILFY